MRQIAEERPSRDMDFRLRIRRFQQRDRLQRPERVTQIPPGDKQDSARLPRPASSVENSKAPEETVQTRFCNCFDS